MIYNMNNLRIVRTSLKEGERNLVLFLMKHFEQDTPQSLFRFLLAKEAQEVKDTFLKYGNSEPKETNAQKARRLKDMPEEEITKLFYDIGIFRDGVMEGAPDCKISYRIGYDANYGDKVEFVKYTQKDPQYPPYENAGRSLDEIINQIIKEKII
jgi:hypothetical protein